jgi:hypothetical protein
MKLRVLIRALLAPLAIFALSYFGIGSRGLRAAANKVTERRSWYTMNTVVVGRAVRGIKLPAVCSYWIASNESALLTSRRHSASYWYRTVQHLVSVIPHE